MFKTNPSKRYQAFTYHITLQKIQSQQQQKIKEHIDQVFYNAIHSFEAVIKPAKLTQKQLEYINEIKERVMNQCNNKFKYLTSYYMGSQKTFLQKLSLQKLSSQKTTLQKPTLQQSSLQKLSSQKPTTQNPSSQKTLTIEQLQEFVDNYDINFKPRILRFGLSNGLRMLEDLFNPIYINVKLQGGNNRDGNQDFKYSS